MATLSKAGTPTVEELGDHPAATALFEWTTVTLGAWLLVGVYLDGWSHQHFRVETFFTPWHGVLYSGLLAVTVFFAGSAAINLSRGRSLRRSLPAGYGLSLIAVCVFGLGGVLDLIWHSTFGFERNFAALLSPPHLLLATCGMVAAAGPLRAAWRRGGAVAPWTAMIAATYVLSTITFFSQFAHPFNDPFALYPGPAASAYGAQALGVISIVFQAAVLAAVLLFVLRRFRLPAGSVLFVLSVNGAAVAAMKDNYWAIPVAVLGGLAGEVLMAVLQPGPSRPLQVRVFASALPLALYAFYFGTLSLIGGIWWEPTVWLGALFLSGAAGLMVSYAVFPPALPDTAGSVAR